MELKWSGRSLHSQLVPGHYVYTLPTGEQRRPMRLAYDGSTGHLEDTGSRRLCSPSLPGSTPRIPTGRADTKVQQQISQLAGVVSSFPGSGGCSRVEQGSESVTTAMNVAQELGDDDLYDYDVLVRLLSDRFDPASRVSAFRSRFHGRFRHHYEDADSFADALSELGRVGYPQSPSEMRQELIAEQFVRGQSDPELKNYLWVVIRGTGNCRH